MYLQQITLNVLFPIFLVVVVCGIGFPGTSARYLENSKNQLHENELAAVKAGSDNIKNQLNTASASAYYSKHDLRSILMAPRDYQQKLHSKFPLNVDLMDVLLEYEDEDRSKRFDDYGHMRFGKRGGEDQFDDYGHMRFGRSV